ncbi:MAG: DUF2782 domain-containing protein [Thiogranum sp.]|nr:DUF2782 domain-containing protein [Thiogranum sp.]
MQRACLSALLLILAGGVYAQPPAPDTLPPPSAVPGESGIEPEVTIRQRGDDRIEEYSVNGEVYMIKITPKNAPAYYLVDTDGDGSLDSSPSEIEPNLLIPSWVLFRW